MNTPITHRKRRWPKVVVVAIAIAFFTAITVLDVFLGPKSGFKHVPGVAQPVPTILDTVDELLATLPKAPMAFNTPPPMNIDDAAAKVELRVGPRQSPAELAKSITAPGTVQVHQVQISSRMQATLFAEDPSGLTITPLTPILQAVSGQAPTVWMWSVKPLKAGNYPIHVGLEAAVRIDGELTPRLIEVFDGTISVTITGPQRVERFVRDNWQWLWTALLVPVAGWWWKRRESKKPEDKKTDDGPKIILPK